MVDFFIDMIGDGIAQYPFLLYSLAVPVCCVIFFMFYNIFYDLIRFK